MRRSKIICLLIFIIFILIHCKKEFKLNRVIDHLKEEDVIESPLKNLYQKFERYEDKLDGKWALFDELSTNETNVWGTSTRFPILGLYDTEKPPGMHVYKDGKEIEFSNDTKSHPHCWKWKKCEQKINVKEKYLQNDVFERDIILPKGNLTIAISAGCSLPNVYLPDLKIELNDEVIETIEVRNKISGRMAIKGMQIYKIHTNVNFGKYRLRLSVSTPEDISIIENHEEVLHIDQLWMQSLNDIIFFSLPKEISNPKDSVEAVYHTEPTEKFEKNPPVFAIRNPLLNYYFTLFKFEHKKEHTLTDLGINEKIDFVKKKIQVNENSINAILAPPKSEFMYELKIPPKAVLEFGHGIISTAKNIEQNDVPFEIFTKNSNEEKLLFSKPLRFECDEEKRIFHQKVTLDGIAGKKTKFHFKTDFIPIPRNKKSGNITSNVAFWYNPVIYQELDQEASSERKKINVVLISIDTLRADHLGCYGYGRDTSPNIDKLAQDSVLFTNAFSQAPCTLPSHMSLLTGLYPVNHNVYVARDKLASELITLSDALRKNFYFSTAFTGGHMISAIFGFSKGFDYYQENKNRMTEDTAEKLFQKSSDWLDEHKEKRFFLFLHTYQTHSPYAPPEDFQMFLDDDAEWKEVGIWEALGRNTSHRFKLLSDKKKKNLIDLYDGEIKYTDECFIKPLMEKMKELNLYDHTMIIFVSDHGEEFFDHHSWAHCHTLYNELIKIPLIIKFPYSKYKGKVVKNTVSLIDIAPTILKQLGIDASGYNFDGQHLFSTVEKNKNEERFSFSESTYIRDDELRNLSHIPGKMSVIANRYKLTLNKIYSDENISFFDPPPSPIEDLELYNLVNDYLEKNNLAFKEEAVVKNLLEKIEMYLRSGKKDKSKREKAALDDELKKRLKALGYIR